MMGFWIPELVLYKTTGDCTNGQNLCLRLFFTILLVNDYTAVVQLLLARGRR